MRNFLRIEIFQLHGLFIINTRNAGRLSYQEVKETVEKHGDILVSPTYKNNKEFLDIKCSKCDETYQQIFDRIRRGFYHGNCPACPRASTCPPKINVTLQCLICTKEFIKKRTGHKYCSVACAQVFNRTDPRHVESGRKGGKIAVSAVVKRSRNEMLFAELCKNFYNDVLMNEPMFDGWDADIIVEDHEVAVLWNGVWHYRKICKGHKIEQTKARDKLKIDIINSYGYTDYTIVDLGGYNPQYVKEEFLKFSAIYPETNGNCLMKMDSIIKKFIPDLKVAHSGYVKNIHTKKKCLACDNMIAFRSTRCRRCAALARKPITE